MNEKTANAGTVVVLEEGAEWPKWIGEYLRHGSSSVVVSHAPGETMTEFASRVGRRLAELKNQIKVAIVACAPFADDAHLRAREAISRALLDAMPNFRRGEVLLAASVEDSDAGKHSIFELAGLLCDSLHGSSRVVRVRFSNGRPESGIMTSLAGGEIDHPAYRALSGHRG